MIFFRRKKPEPPPKQAAKPAAKKAPPAAPAKTALKPLSAIVTQRVLTAEGWRRTMERRALKKVK
jgi:hypothetical protein